jgi:hypothetical protein
MLAHASILPFFHGDFQRISDIITIIKKNKTARFIQYSCRLDWQKYAGDQCYSYRNRTARMMSRLRHSSIVLTLLLLSIPP